MALSGNETQSNVAAFEAKKFNVENKEANLFSGAAGVIHYIWLVKADLKKPLEYAAVLGMLLMYRVVAWLVARKGSPNGVKGAAPQLTVP